MLIRACAAALFVAASVGAVHAQDVSGCDKFKWSLARERAWFAAGAKPLTAGAEISLADEAYAVALTANESAGFAPPPERPLKAGEYGGVVKIGALPKPGVYEITLSDEAWVDVVQNGVSIKSSDFSGQKNCAGVRKSVRFTLAAGATTLQISNSAAPTIQFAIAPAP